MCDELGSGFHYLFMKILQGVFRKLRFLRRLVTGVVCTVVLFLLVQYAFPGCSNSDAEAFLTYLCDSYKKGDISGDICPHLCSQSFTDVQCQAQHLGKEVVFTAAWRTKRIVIKAKRHLITSLEPVYWRDSKKHEHYPDQKTFVQMGNAQFKYALLQNFSWMEAFFGSHFHNAEMNSIYALLQQTEYLFSLVLQSYNTVASIVGTCGHAYAVEFLSPIETTFLQERPVFKQRAQIALHILDNLQLLQTAMGEQIHQCDMKPNHFGIDNVGNVKMLDLDALALQTTVQNNIANTGDCQSDKDCDFFDCTGRCNDMGHCDAVVLNNNLQVISLLIFKENDFTLRANLALKNVYVEHYFYTFSPILHTRVS